MDKRNLAAFLSSFDLYRVATIVIAILFSLFIGINAAKGPIVVWILLGASIGFLLLHFPIHILIIVTVLAATVSRSIVFMGAPAIINFIHFPLALCAAFVAATRGVSRSSLARSIAIGFILLLFISLASWMLSGGRLIRPFLDWLVFSEPFLIIYAILRMSPSLKQRKFLWKLALAISFVQFPLGLLQFFTGHLTTRPLGHGDILQGTFTDLSAAAHVAGAVALIGVLVCVARGLSRAAIGGRIIWLFGAAALLIVPVLSDAIHCIAAFLPALILLLLIFTKIRVSRLVIALLIFAFAIFRLLSYSPQLLRIVDRAGFDLAITAKVDGLLTVASEVSEYPGGWLLGLGPGNSISRVALMGLYAKPDSPVALLNLEAPSITGEIWAIDWFSTRSSVWTGISSWLGLFGDLGLIGLGIYLWIFWKLWQNLRGRQSWEIGAAKACLVMTGLLGFMFSWLEEPGFMVLVALVVGLGLLSQRCSKNNR